MDCLTESFGLSDWSTVKTQLETGKSPINFTGATGPTLRANKFGVIGVIDFFDGDATYDALELSKDDVISELQQTFDTFIDHGGDNTYNYSGPMEREFNWEAFENSETEETFVFFAVHTGLDIRAGYTNYFCFKYDSYDAFLDGLSTFYSIAYGSFKVAGEKYYISLSGYATSEYTSIYISDENNNEASFFYPSEAYLDLYDKDDATTSVTEFLKDNDIAATELTWEA